jgi:hypothetical protein
LQPGQHFVQKGDWYDPTQKKRDAKMKEVVDDEGGYLKE